MRFWSQKDPSRACLIAVLLLGLLARAALTSAWSPGFTGYSDSGIYFQGGVDSLWSDPLRTVGYSMFLRAMRLITPQLALVITVQHLLGLASAGLIFLVVRRCGGSRWVALVPAAVLSLNGDQLFLEHAALSDALFIFLLTVMLYAALRASSSSITWAILAGIVAGLAVWDRESGIELAPAVGIWLLVCRGRPTRRTLLIAVTTLLTAGATVGLYAVLRNDATGLSGLTTNGSWNIYGRVAPWADCSEFQPPLGTGRLCDTTPVNARRGHGAEWYIYSPESPAQRLIGPPYRISSDPYAMRRLLQFSEAAIAAQPLSYVHAIWLDVLRLFNPDGHSFGDLSAQAFVNFLLYGPDGVSGRNDFVTYWETLLYPGERSHHASIGLIRGWEKLTRITGLPMGLLLFLCLASPWLVERGQRAKALLLAGLSLVLLIFPILTKGYDYRFVIPAFGPLCAVGAMSSAGAVTRVRNRVRHPRNAALPL